MFKINELLEATDGRLIQGNKNATVSGISIDSRTIKPGEAFIAIKGNNFDGHNFIDKAIDKGTRIVIIQHPASSIQHPKGASFILVKDTTRALGDIARFQRQKFNIPLIAITGTNGKTTTKEMIAWVLSKKFKVLKNEGTKNNHIGLPLALLNLKPYHDIIILELGTNHFGEIDYLTKICLPNIGIITNIGPAHLEYFGSIGGVFREKYTLIENLKKPYIAILNADDAILKKQLIKANKKPFFLGFGIKERSDYLAYSIKYLGEKLEFLVKKYRFTLNTLGYYNVYNALAAITVGRLFGINYNDMVRSLANFDFPEGRLKIITSGNIRFIDDTYNSNPVSLKEAIDVLRNFKTKGKKVFIMGDMLELGKRKKFFHYQAGKEVAKYCDIFITVGSLSKLAAKTARFLGLDSKNIFTCESCHQARDILFNKISLKEEDIVLVKGSRLMKMEEVLRV